MIRSFLQRELEKQLAIVEESLVQTPPLRDKLLPLLDRIEALLSKVDQSPAKSVKNALSPLMNALIMEDLLKHSDVDVNVGVASCISEIIRITAPDDPYDKDKMKNVFQLIVSSLENLSDISSRSYEKRASILETMAKVRSCVMMMDLECYQMIIGMFENFLKAIRDDHADIIFASMEKIMTLVLEESDDISPELLAPILATLKRNNEVAKPITKKLAERVLQNSADKIRPYLKQVIRFLDSSLDDYSEVVFCVCGENTDTVERSNESTLNDQLARKDGIEETNIQDENPTAARSPKLIVSNDGIKEILNKRIMVDANSPKKADSDSQLDANLKIKTKCDDVAAEKPVSSKDKPEFVESQQVLDNHKIPEMPWSEGIKMPLVVSDDEIPDEREIKVTEHAQESAALTQRKDNPKTLSGVVARSNQGERASGNSALPPSGRYTLLDKGKRVAIDDSSKHRLSKKSKYSKFGGSDSPSNHGKIEKGDVRTSLNDVFTIELPKGVISLNWEQSFDFVKNLHTSDDPFSCRDLTPEQIKYAATHIFAQFTSLFSQIVTLEDSQSVSELQGQLEAKDQELNKVVHEVEKLKTELDAQKRASEASQNQLIEYFKQKEAETFSQGMLQGIELCRKRLFRSAPGQSFLKELLDGFLDAYHQSSLYLKNMNPHIPHFVVHGFKAALKQARKKGFTEKLDPSSAVEGLKPSPAFTGDETLPLDYPWWLPVMKRAAEKLAQSNSVDPELHPADDMIYDLGSFESSSCPRITDPLPALPYLADTRTPEVGEVAEDDKN